MSEKELEGAALDEAVALALGWKHPGAIGTTQDGGVKGVPWCLSEQNDWWETPKGEHVCGPCCGYPHPYSTEWQYGGPIVEQERICIVASAGYDMGGPLEWSASVGAYPHYIDESLPLSAYSDYSGRGETALIAAMRAFVASKRQPETLP